MDDILKKRIEKIEKRLDDIEEFMESFPTFEKTTTYEKGDEVDELYDKTLWVVIQHERCSASLIQRRMQVGFNRACRLLEQLEVNGIIEKREDSIPRKVLISKEDIESLKEKLEAKVASLKEKKKSN